MATKKTTRVPAPKFSFGDIVCVPGTKFAGTVSHTSEYDKHIRDYRYRVSGFDGSRAYYDGKSLVRVPATTAKKLGLGPSPF